MKLRCPACGNEFALDRAVKERDLEELIKSAARFGADWPLVSEYLDSFRVRRDGALGVKKRLRLLDEIWEIYSTGKVKLGREEYWVERQELREALAQVCNRELLGLKNHNYLKQVLSGAARKASGRLERERREKEEQLRAGYREGERWWEIGGTNDSNETQIAVSPDHTRKFLHLLRVSLDCRLTPQERGLIKKEIEKLAEESANGKEESD